MTIYAERLPRKTRRSQAATTKKNRKDVVRKQNGLRVRVNPYATY